MDGRTGCGRNSFTPATRWTPHYDEPETLNLDVLLQADYTKFLPYTWIDGNHMYASFTHLVGYSSNYYTYLYDKVIALDFFNQFNRANLLEDPIALKYRQTRT